MPTDNFLCCESFEGLKIETVRLVNIKTIFYTWLCTSTTGSRLLTALYIYVTYVLLDGLQDFLQSLKI